MKKCNSCSQLKDEDEFSKKKSNPDGLQRQCKTCCSAYYKKWRKANGDVAKASYDKWRTANPEKAYAISSRYVKKNRDKTREWKRRSERKRRAQATGSKVECYTEQDVLDTYGTVCYLCGNEIDLEASRRSGELGWQEGLQIDHVIPLVRTGSDTLKNVRPTHGLCNNKKKDREAPTHAKF